MLVIGAGVSGLHSAQRLTAKGYDVSVLEARDRIGGRIKTDKQLGFLVDLGASWVHNIDENPVYDLTKRHNARGVQVLRLAYG